MSQFENLREHPLFDNAAMIAIKQAEVSALTNGNDVPVGAVALHGAFELGKGYATDGASGHDHMHAEIAALTQARNDSQYPADTLVSTLEPCEQCQDTLATVETIKTVVFVLPRNELSDRNLVLPRRSIAERAARFELPYNVVRLDNPILKSLALEPLDYTTRDLETGITKVDSEGFQAHIAQRTA